MKKIFFKTNNGIRANTCYWRGEEPDTCLQRIVNIPLTTLQNQQVFIESRYKHTAATTPAKNKNKTFYLNIPGYEGVFTVLSHKPLRIKAILI